MPNLRASRMVGRLRVTRELNITALRGYMQALNMTDEYFLRTLKLIEESIRAAEDLLSEFAKASSKSDDE